MEGARVTHLLDTAAWINGVTLPEVLPPRIRRLMETGELKGLCSVSLLETAILQRRLQLPIVDRQHFRLDAQDLVRRLHFRQPALGERFPIHLPVPDIAIGDGDEFDVIPQLGPLDRGATGAQLGVVGVCAEDDDAGFAVRSIDRFNRR